MGGLNGSSSLQNFAYSNRQLTVSPFSYLHVSSTYSDSNLVGLNGPSTSSDANHHHHQRCSSEDSLFEEEDQPSWFEDLLGEPETTPNPSKGHRRSASESYASFLGTAADIKEESSSSSTTSKSDNHEKEETNNIDALTDQKGNIVPSKTDSKRAKQQSAHRSRVRKLKYIAELERTVQLLQGEGSEIQAELEFINQQNLILSMENRALRQRLDGLSQEQLIKHFEQEMLERELTRLQTLYQLQSKQQMQMQQISQHNRTKSRDLETHFANFTIRNNEMGTNKGSAATSIRI